MVGWHHQLDGHEFEKVPGVGDGQGSLVCCSPWGRKELDANEGLNQTDLKDSIFFCKMIYLALFLINNYNAILHSQFTYRPSGSGC